MAGTTDRQTTITAYWNLRGATYDDQPGHGLDDERERAAWLAALRDLLPPAPADILDVGTGTGFLALLLAAQGHRVIGIDLAEGMLAGARAKGASLPVPPPDFQLGDALDPPLDPASVDAVVSRHLLWTLTDPPRAFANWRRLLRPGGRLVAIDGLWFAAAPRLDPDAPTPWRRAFARHYSDAVRAGLPLMDSDTLDPILAVIRAAGFAAVRAARLEAIERLVGAADPGGEHPPRYVVTAMREG